MNKCKIVLFFIVGISLFSCASYKEIIKGSYSISEKVIDTERGSFIAGKVLSKETGKVIKDASISIVGSKIGDFTDEKGKFQIKIPPGKYKLDIKFTGYDNLETKEFRVKEGEQSNLLIHLGTTKIYQTY